MKSIIQVSFFLYFVFHCTNGRPAETNIQPASGTTRARFLLDSLGTFTNAQKTAVSGTKVLGEGVDVIQDMFVENTNSIAGHGKTAIESDTQALGNTLKAAVDAGGQLANSAAIIILSVPKFLASSAQTIVGGDNE